MSFSTESVPLRSPESPVHGEGVGRRPTAAGADDTTYVVILRALTRSDGRVSMAKKSLRVLSTCSVREPAENHAALDGQPYRLS